MKKILKPFIALYERFIINRFHRIYYKGRFAQGQPYMNTFWDGVATLKCPLDMWIYQEIIFEVKPDLIIETGTSSGGSALFLANLLDIIGKGAVMTVDINKVERRKHPRIEYVLGSSSDEKVIKDIVTRYKYNTCLVILDSDHHKDHVAKEIALLSKYVSIGSYLIVEDSNINGHPAAPKYGPGPYEAISDFLKTTKDFVIDSSREKFLVTFNPNGYLKRIR